MLQKEIIQPNKDDRNYITKVTARMPSDAVRLLESAYCMAWIEAYHSESLEHKKGNAGRFAANTIIRKLAREYMETGNIDIPRICGNCDHCESWQGQYHCNKFNQNIPPEYVTKENDCEQYENAIPF